MKKKFNVYKIGDYLTTATTHLRGKVKIFQLIERGATSQIIENLQKAGISDIQSLKIIIFLDLKERKNALKHFLEQI